MAIDKTLCPKCEEACRPSTRLQNNKTVVLECNVCEFMWHATCCKDKDMAKYAKALDNIQNLIWICDSCLPKKNEFIDCIKATKTLSEGMKKCLERLERHEELIHSLSTKNKELTVPTTSRQKEIVDTPKLPYSRVLSKKTPTSESANSVKRGQSAKKPRSITFVKPPIVIVKPKSDSQSDLSQLFNAFDPSKDAVKNIKMNRKGEAVILCNDEASISAVKFKIQQEIGSNCSIIDPVQKETLLKVIAPANHGIDESNILEKIKNQNECVSETSTIELFDYKERGSYIMAILKTDESTFQEILKAGKLRIHYSRCRVFEHISVRRCFKCARYGHLAAECKGVITCSNCAEPHETKDCDGNSIKCINCCESYGSNANDDKTAHQAWSFACPLLKRKWKSLQRRVSYKK